MVALLPFGPVEFVYNLEDTKGDPISSDKIIFWWRENGGVLNKKITKNTYSNLKRIHIGYEKKDSLKYFREGSFRTGGYAKRENNKFSIMLHPRYDEETIEAYGILCHEIAHILLGHLGNKTIVKIVKEKTINKKIAEDRSYLTRNIQEVEAELVAWIVFNRFGIEKQSEAYIANWIIDKENLKEIGMGEVLKAAGKIQEMGKRLNVF